MGRATSGDLNRTSNGAVKYFTSNSPRGSVGTFGNKKSSFMPAPNPEESKTPRAKKQQTIRRAGDNDPDGPNPLKKLRWLTQD